MKLMFINQNANQPFSIGYRIAKHIITTHVVQGNINRWRKKQIASKTLKYLPTSLW